MKYCLYFFILICLFKESRAQIWEGYPMDSVMVYFSHDTLSYIPDTAAVPLWQVGKTVKRVFANDTNGVVAIMTDTVNHYPASADNWFILKPNPLGYYSIINFWHRYETDSGKDGGVVEFSIDSGITWQNVLGDCHIEGMLWYEVGTRTENFYAASDTLPGGMPAFSGKSDTTVLSRFQFSSGYLPSHEPPLCQFHWETLIRFRFMSDTLADTLSGWIIDSVKIETDRYIVSVEDVNLKKALQPSPNPSQTGVFVFPQLRNEKEYSIELYNMIGKKVLEHPYSRSIDISSLPRGHYVYRVFCNDVYHTGKLYFP